ncbi:hypothetical protein JTB14_032455 [Gonioctena quinquepunctata]|nr:hypothetical protein JTB14_032455 [Gonioctena quinquepunctata]
MSTKRTLESPPTSGDQPLKRPRVPIKRARSSKQNKSQMDFINYCKTQLETTDSLDEFDASAIAWAKKLKRMAPTQAIYVDMLINEIINQGLLNHLTNHTAVVEQTLSPVQPYPSPTLFSPVSPYSTVSSNSFSTQQDQTSQTKTSSDLTSFYEQASSSYQIL